MLAGLTPFPEDGSSAYLRNVSRLLPQLTTLKHCSQLLLWDESAFSIFTLEGSLLPWKRRVSAH
jgi:hypothetical protein